MTFLVKHKQSGIWYYRKTRLLSSGKRKEFRRSLRTADFKHAQFLALKLYFENAHEQNLNKNNPNAQPLSLSLSLKTAIAEFLAEKSKTGFWCAKEYRRGEVMLVALEEALEGFEVHAVTRKDANRFKQQLLKTDRSITTVNNYLKRATMLFEWLMLRGEIRENPFKGLTIKQRRNVSQLRDAYSPEDKVAYLKFAEGQEEWRKWVLLLLRYTGARPSEICQLYKDDVDIPNRLIVIDGKRPDQTLKTLNSARIIPIHSKLIRFGFLDYVQKCEHVRLFPALRNLEKGGYSHTFVTWFSKQRDKAKKAGLILPELYGARHTAATEMKNAGVPNQFASAVLGHSNNSITYDRYGKNVDTSRLRRAVEAIGSKGSSSAT